MSFLDVDAIRIPLMWEIVLERAERRKREKVPRRDGGHDEPLFSSTGRVALREVTVAVLVEDIEGAMDAAGELERGPFPMGALRRTAGAHMAALGSSSDVRAQIQSHGLGCIQARHRDRRNYMVDFRAWPRTCRAEVLLSSDSRVGTGSNLGASLH